MVVAQIWTGRQRRRVDVERSQPWQPVRQPYQCAYFFEIGGGIRGAVLRVLCGKRYCRQQYGGSEYEQIATLHTIVPFDGTEFSSWINKSFLGPSIKNLMVYVAAGIDNGQFVPTDEYKTTRVEVMEASDVLQGFCRKVHRIGASS